jgi:mannose-1-phosphate guanylyltransferase
MMANAEVKDLKFLRQFLSVLLTLGIDLGIMEKSDNVFVYSCHFGWADLGTWGTIGEHRLADYNENLLLDSQAQLHDCHGNVIRLPRGRVAVISGLRDFVVAEEGNVLMICPKEDVATQRRMMTEAQTQMGIE